MQMYTARDKNSCLIFIFNFFRHAPFSMSKITLRKAAAICSASINRVKCKTIFFFHFLTQWIIEINKIWALGISDIDAKTFGYIENDFFYLINWKAIMDFPY